jgi:hypothetical protein
MKQNPIIMIQDQSISDTTSTHMEDERDEVLEVKKLTSKDTFRVKTWRFVVTGVLTLTALAVTLTTYRFLVKEEKKNFIASVCHIQGFPLVSSVTTLQCGIEVCIIYIHNLMLLTNAYLLQYEKFARTIGVAAVSQQRDITESLFTLGDTISAGAIADKATWPFYTLPLFEAHALHTRTQARFEAVAIANVVPVEDREAWEDYSIRHVDWVVESHLIDATASNTTPDFPSTDSFQPIISAITPDGIVPEHNSSEPYYMPLWSYSPAPHTYGLVNVDFNSVPDYHDIIKAVIALKSQTLMTRVRPYVSSAAYSKEEHDAFHSKLPDSISEHPHSFAYHPVNAYPGNKTSKVVGVLLSAVAWDVSLRNLLPKGVEGIIAEIRNNCNQTYTYELIESDAFFRGEGALHEDAFNDMEIEIDLTWTKDPVVLAQPGHCLYSMVSQCRVDKAIEH